MPESVSHPSNSLRVGLGTLRPLKAWKTDRGGCLERSSIHGFEGHVQCRGHHRVRGGGGRDYLVSIEGEEGLWVNACNPSWIERGLRSFCDECYPFFSDRLYEGAEVVGHLGGGTVEDASRWYEENKALYRG